MSQTLFVSSDEVISIGDMPVELGATRSYRASQILPVNPVKRLAFVALRAVFGERGRVAAWTRNWRGPWQSKILANGETYTHISRRVCIAWEHSKLEEILSR